MLEGGSFACIFIGFSILSGEGIENNQFIQPIYSLLVSLSTYKLFTLFIVAAITLQVLRSVITFVSQALASRFAVEVQMNIQQSVYDRIFGISYSSVNNMKMGDLMELSITPSSCIRLIVGYFNTLIVASLMVIGYIIFMGFISIPLSCAVLTLCLFVGLAQRFVLNKIAKASECQNKRGIELSTNIAQNIEGVKEVHLFNFQKYILKTIQRTLQSLSNSAFKLDLWSGVTLPINEMFSVLLVGVVLILGLFFLKDSMLPTTPALLTFMTLTYRLCTRLQMMMTAVSEAIYYIGPMNRVKEFLFNKEDQLLNFSSGIEAPSGWKKVELRDVGFHYPNKKELAVKELSVSINRGEVIAVVGHSGAGKSTLIDLLLRLYEPTHGEIFIDGRAASEYSLESYRALFAVVSQNAFLFHNSIGENIAFGDEKSNLAEVIRAAKRANAHGFITKLFEGYDTIIGERGLRLSGGERQRIALARALHRKSDILILDEATSHLDSLSEKFIQETIRELKGEKTIIMVAHRLSTVVHADRIIVLEKGAIVEMGTHLELLGREGLYQNFWALQEI